MKPWLLVWLKAFWVVLPLWCGFSFAKTPSPEPAPQLVQVPDGRMVAPDIARILNRGELVVALLDRDTPPFVVVKDGVISGVDISLVRQVAAELKVPVRFDRSAKTYDEVVQMVALGRTDLGVSKLAQSSKNDDFHDKLMQIGTGPSGGSFGPIGETLCEAMNKVRPSTLVRCVLFPSAGSVFNIYAVASGSLQLGLGQEDLVAEAAVNSDAKGGDMLRTVALLHNSPIGIMVRKAAGITELSQISKGVVNKGNRGSGVYANATAVLKAMNLADRDFAAVTFLPSNEFERAFCEGRVDVIFNALAHPSDLYRRLRNCGGEFLDIPPDIMKKMMADNQYLRPMDIAAGMYDAQQAQVKTLGMRNMLISNPGVDEEAIYRVARLINAEYKTVLLKQPYLSSMKQLHPGEVTSLAVPLHPGAKRALQETRP